jgi:hypothetical protein
MRRKFSSGNSPVYFSIVTYKTLNSIWCRVVRCESVDVRVGPIVLQFSYGIVASGYCERCRHTSNGQKQDCVVGDEAKWEEETVRLRIC